MQLGTKPALAARKAAGGKLGNPRNVERAGELARRIQVSAANEFAAKLLPAATAIRRSGAETLDAICGALNKQGIPKR